MTYSIPSNYRSAPARSGAASGSGGGFGEFGTGSGSGRPPAAAGGGGRSNHAEKAEQLAQMGFDKTRALEILDIVDGNVELALDMLSS
jgi:hypothetical protein